jgi:hypothetical protein
MLTQVPEEIFGPRHEQGDGCRALSARLQRHPILDQGDDGALQEVRRRQHGTHGAMHGRLREDEGRTDFMGEGGAKGLYEK